MSVKLETIIGLEIHLQLKTKTKLFCGCKNFPDETKANLNICPICLGHPGVLPVLNKESLEKIIKLGLALNGQVTQFSYFERKNYFYPDLPKGYQISQFSYPIIKNAKLEIDCAGLHQLIRIRRIHLEEDAAKLVHGEDATLIDFNRAGIPLLEIVTEPDFHRPKEAKIFLQELRLLARYLDISEADMEKGQMRCDANISLRPEGDKKFYPKAEVKNLNSFKAVEKALSYEILRQKELWEIGQSPDFSSTLGWDEKKEKTIIQRLKEESEDYRYFPEPDLPPIILEKKEIDQIYNSLPELPQAKRARFIEIYGFSLYEAKILTDEPEMAQFVEKVISELKAWLVSLETVEGSEQEIWQQNKKKLVKMVANWLINRLLGLAYREGIETKNFRISPENFSEFIILIYQNKISSKIAQVVLEKMFKEGLDPDSIIRQENLTLLTKDDILEKIVERVIKNNPQPVSDFRSGKENALQYLIGQIMKESGGKAHPQKVKEMLEKKL